MRAIRSALLALAAALPLSALAAPTLTVCVDSAAGGFNYTTATCVTDNGAGDLLPGVGGAIVMADFALGGFTVKSAIGEPVFAPGFGMSLSTDGTVSGTWIVAVAQTGLEFGAAPNSLLHMGADFTGSTAVGPGTAGYAVYVDDQNRGLDLWGPVGTAVASGSGFGSGGGYAPVSDPFSLLAFVTLDASNGATFYSTDLTITVPEPASVALLGVGLLGLLTTRRPMQPS